MIGRSGERGSGKSVLAARHDDDDDLLSIYLSIYLRALVHLSGTQATFFLFSTFKIRNCNYSKIDLLKF